jgi:molybdopterin molybdotransferase
MPTKTTSNKTISVNQAFEILMAQACPLADHVTLNIEQALGAVVAEPVFTAIDLPHWDHSAMDGYAVCFATLKQSPGAIPVTQRIAAGDVGTPLTAGSAARIFTGAPIPAGADTVIQQEDCQEQDQHITINPEARAQIKLGQHCRRRGEDLTAGSLLISVGVRLQPQHLGLMAAAGLTHVSVYRKLKVAFLTTGNELVAPGEPLHTGQIYDSNRVLLQSLLQRLQCDVIDCGQIPDSQTATQQALQDAATHADLVIVSGGVSVGAEDHVGQAIGQLGQIHFSKVAMRPGKPITAGTIGTTPILGSPGNPVSLFVTFCLFARPFILAMQGVPNPVHKALFIAADFTEKRSKNRQEYKRARLHITDNQQMVIQLFSRQSSAALDSLTWADGLVVIPPQTAIQSGDIVEFLPFNELLQ